MSNTKLPSNSPQFFFPAFKSVDEAGGPAPQAIWCLQGFIFCILLGLREPLKNSGSHIDASHSRQPLVKGERLVRYEVNAVMLLKHCNRLVLRWSGLQSCFS